MIITKIVQHLRRDDFCCAFANYLLMFVFYPTKTCRTPCFDCSADEVRLLSISSPIIPRAASSFLIALYSTIE